MNSSSLVVHIDRFETIKAETCEFLRSSIRGGATLSSSSCTVVDSDSDWLSRSSESIASASVVAAPMTAGRLLVTLLCVGVGGVLRDGRRAGDVLKDVCEFKNRWLVTNPLLPASKELHPSQLFQAFEKSWVLAYLFEENQAKQNTKESKSRTNKARKKERVVQPEWSTENRGEVSLWVSEEPA